MNISDLRDFKKNFTNRKIKVRRNQRYGFLTTIKIVGRVKKSGAYLWLCRCDCGVETKVNACRLTSGKTKSCGCLQTAHRESHLKTFFAPAICRNCGVEYITNKTRTTRGLCRRCGNAESVRAYRERQAL